MLQHSSRKWRSARRGADELAGGELSREEADGVTFIKTGVLAMTIEPQQISEVQGNGTVLLGWPGDQGSRHCRKQRAIVGDVEYIFHARVRFHKKALRFARLI